MSKERPDPGIQATGGDWHGTFTMLKIRGAWVLFEAMPDELGEKEKEELRKKAIELLEKNTKVPFGVIK